VSSRARPKTAPPISWRVKAGARSFPGACVFRTSNSTSSIPTNGTIPATTMMAIKGMPGGTWACRKQYPMSLKAMMVPMPAPVR